MSNLCSIKCLFFSFNLLFLRPNFVLVFAFGFLFPIIMQQASGVALITVGALQYSTYSDIGAFAGRSLSKIAVVLIAAGVTIALVSLFGFIGAFCNSATVVCWFIFILVMIIIFEIIIGATVYTFRSKTTLVKMNNAMKDKARKVVSEYSLERRQAIDRIQEKFKCCGADGDGDWSNSVGWGKPDEVPDSCCVVKSEGCGKEKDKIHTLGCISAIRTFLLKNLMWVGALCIALAVLEIFGVIIGVLLHKDIKRKNYDNIS